MSLRQIAKQLGVSHTLLVLWRQGKRTLPSELEARYHSLVANGYAKSGYTKSPVSPSASSWPPRAGSSAWSEHRTIRVSWV